MSHGKRAGLAPYVDLGWPAEERDGTVELITGTVVDALEVPSVAGVLAASWWRYTQGHPDEIRCLPRLPDPGRALVVIAAGDRHFFLARAGDCPWQAEDQVTSAVAGKPEAAVISWHSRGSRIPAPSQGTSQDPDRAAWVCLPDRGVKLCSPAVLLRLLTTAMAMTRFGPHMLALDQGIVAIPAFRGSSASAQDRGQSRPTVR